MHSMAAHIITAGTAASGFSSHRRHSDTPVSQAGGGGAARAALVSLTAAAAAAALTAAAGAAAAASAEWRRCRSRVGPLGPPPRRCTPHRRFVWDVPHGHSTIG